MLRHARDTTATNLRCSYPNISVLVTYLRIAHGFARSVVYIPVFMRCNRADHQCHKAHHRCIINRNAPVIRSGLSDVVALVRYVFLLLTLSSTYSPISYQNTQAP